MNQTSFSVTSAQPLKFAPSEVAAQPVLLKRSTQPWVASRRFDLIFLLLPSFIMTGLILHFHDIFNWTSEAPLWGWIPIALIAEYGHQYSALYRTYFDHTEIRSRPKLYIFVPILSLLVAFVLYQVGGNVLYWQGIIYLAIYHFIRQQYGFMRMYSRNEKNNTFGSWLDTVTVYTATLYPLLYEHTHLPRRYTWADSDNILVPIHLGALQKYLFPIYATVFFLYIFKEAHQSIQSRSFNWPKNLLIFGTALSWLVGLVIFDGEFAFYAATQICHAIPYTALVWAYGNKKWVKQTKTIEASTKNHWFMRNIFKPQFLVPFIFIIVALAYLESGLWHSLIDPDNSYNIYFARFNSLGPATDKQLSWLLPLLAVPQLTHYILDAFIWRMKKGDSRWFALLRKAA